MVDPKRVKLLDGGQVKFTDPNGVNMFINAEHARDGGWLLEVKFPGETVMVELPPRSIDRFGESLSQLRSTMARTGLSFNALGAAMVGDQAILPLEPYDWKHKS